MYMHTHSVGYRAKMLDLSHKVSTMLKCLQCIQYKSKGLWDALEDIIVWNYFNMKPWS